MIQRYDQVDEALEHLCQILSQERADRKVYVPMASTVKLLRRANALCAKNMIATDFYIESGAPDNRSIKPRRPTRGKRG